MWAGFKLVRLAAKAINIHQQNGTFIAFNLARKLIQHFVNPEFTVKNRLIDIIIRVFNHMEDVETDTLILRKIHSMRIEMSMHEPGSPPRRDMAQRMMKLYRIIDETYGMPGTL